MAGNNLIIASHKYQLIENQVFKSYNCKIHHDHYIAFKQIRLPGAMLSFTTFTILACMSTYFHINLGSSSSIFIIIRSFIR